MGYFMIEIDFKKSRYPRIISALNLLRKGYRFFFPNEISINSKQGLIDVITNTVNIYCLFLQEIKKR